ncbi:MFS transporter [Aquihabitans sp. G128]|uniref:MFS transporter n=1 Tax=Aquihabitans sp. G128 TaxID=2849779 RepID=UPI001C22F4A2|nr:MFS transporter [Aquihabitans sp. G128]QXC61236.1 MFS transporter [Aquihabitans sp. G128]
MTTTLDAEPAEAPVPEPDKGPWRSRAWLGAAGWYPLAILFGLNMADELDRSAYLVLLPEIRDDFGLSNSGILSVVALAAACALLLTVPIAHLADRSSRVRLALLGAAVWGAFSLGTGLSFAVWVLIVMRSGAAIGQGVIFPTHNSLLADYYPIESRTRVYSIHRAANSVGVIIGLLVGAGLAEAFGWRTPFVVFAFPTFVLVVLGLKLTDPGRGHFEREAADLGVDTTMEEEPPSFAEAVRMVWTIRSLRRIFVALPFLAASIVGLGSLASLQYAETFDLTEVQRAMANVPVQLVELLGVWIGAKLTTMAFRKGAPHIFKILTYSAFLASAGALGFAAAPNVALAVVAHALVAGALVIVGPGVMASLSLAIPPRARSMGFSIGALWVLPGLLVIPFVGWVGDNWGFRWGMVVLVPVFLVGGLLIASVGAVIEDDIAQVWTGTATRAQMLQERADGKLPLLSVRGVHVSYGDVRVLFGVDLDVAEGEVIALLGTNGAGKSTLLKAISGVAIADRGAIVFDGRDITHAPPEEIAPRGIAQVPGGQGVFPGLTVAENLRAAGWMLRHDRALRTARVAEALELFPILAQRADDPAADLSGGQQQMLALAMAFLAEPRLLMIDELSLGLAPVVVEQLLGVVRDLSARGTTIILVEQSVNVALTVADTAYFMEKGEIRFHGPTAELLERPDVLRSVFLQGAAAGLADVASIEADVPAPVAGNGGPAVPARARVVAASPPAPAVEADAAALSVEGVSVRFGGIRAVSDVSFSVAPGEVVGLIGPNGAGKTTVLDLVSGYTTPETGRVLLGGLDVSGLRPHRRALLGLGRSFQDSRLFPSLTVEEVLLVALERWLDVRDPLNAAFRLPPFVDSEVAAHHRVDELVELLGLGAFRSKFVGELSTGSRRVVDIGCVLAHGPSVVLLDEPSSGIAQREAEALGPLLLGIRDSLDASLVVIEHDMSLISSVSDRLVALDQGRLVTDGPPADVLAHPAVVESYLGGDAAVIGRSGATQPAATPSGSQP